MYQFGLKPEWFGSKVMVAALTLCLIQVTLLTPAVQSKTKAKKLNYLKSLSIEGLLQTERRPERSLAKSPGASNGDPFFSG